MPKAGRWRRAIAILGIAALVAVVAFLLCRPRPAPSPSVAVPEPAGDGQRDLEMTRGVPFNLPQPLDFPPDSGATAVPPPPAPDPAPAPPPPPDLATADSTPFAGGVATLSAPAALAAPDTVASSTVLAEVALRPVVMVHPVVPEKIIQKRKIDASVLLQARVDATGHVREVRLLRRIENCEECNQSAIEAVERMVYDAPPAGGEVWTVPFEMRFTHRR